MEYRLTLNEGTGMIECIELDLEAPTLAELKSKIKEFEKEQKSSVKKTPVIYIIGSRFGRMDDAIKYGIAGAKHSRYRHWVSFGKEREVISDDQLIIDTPENRTKVVALVALRVELDKKLFEVGKEIEALETLESVGNKEKA